MVSIFLCFHSEQLRDRLNLNMDYLEKLSDEEDVKFQVDQAISDVSI